MPRISTFYGIVIAMYFSDHGHPHFHARHASGEAKVRIDELAARSGWRDALGDRVTAMNGLTPDITAAAVVSHGVLRLTFEDGLEAEVDVLSRMHGPVFALARTQEGFAEVSVDRETGTVIWPGGADLAPDTLYERVQSGAWPSCC